MQIGLHDRNFGLDVMRVLAITLVVANHFVGNFSNADIGVFWYLAYFGVEVFFVLSGFLIGTILVKSLDPVTGQFHFRELWRFLQRRWLRTLPLYYLLLLINYLFTASVSGMPVGFDARYLFFLQNLFSFPPSFFGESWSLCIEEWFYILFPMGLFLVAKLFPSPSGRSVLAYTLLFIVAGILLRQDTAHREFNVVMSRLDAIAYGVALAVLNHYYFMALFRRFSTLFGLLGSAIVFTAILLFLGRQAVGSFYLLYYPFIGIGLALFLLFLKEVKPPAKYPRVKSGIQFISKLSYSLYLNNLVFISLVKVIFPAPVFLQVVIGLTILFLVSFLTYRGVEKFFIRVREKVVPASSAQTIKEQCDRDRN
jgi:peptidoglycan/LPS O-acetylase OafA/YrhL